MTEKVQNQMKRSINGLKQQQQQTLEIDSGLQDLISKIQQTILDTSQAMKQEVIKFEEKQLINFKQDLFKTQQDFIKLRAQRNQEVIKNNVMKQKTQVESKFNTQMKKSLEMNAQYQQMKNLLKKMNDQEHQLTLQIQYVKKKIQKEKYQGKCLDLEIYELQNVKNTPNPKNSSKINQQMKLFTDLVNKCDQKYKNTFKNSLKHKQQSQKSKTSPQNLQRNVQKKIKQKIQDINEYIENIPLELNFMQNKLLKAIEQRKQKKLKQIQSLKTPQLQDKILDEEQNLSTHQTNDNQLSVIGSKKFKLPSIKQKGKKPIKMSKSTSNLLKITPKSTKNQDLNWEYSSVSKTRTQKSSEALRMDEKISLLEYLPRNSQLLQEILTDPQVKQYLYKLMFD